MPSQYRIGTTRVLIVDDHPFVRRGLASIIAELPDVEACGEAAGIEEAYAQIRATRPTVAVIDISLPDGNGLELTKDIRVEWPHIRVLVTSMHDEKLFAERALRAGALGYIHKSEEPETFVRALRSVIKGRVFVSPQMTDQLLNRVIGEGKTDVRSPLQRLSDRELEVFELIGRGLETKQIAHRLQLSRKTVETHRERIKNKLNIRSGTELTRQAFQWVFDEESSPA
jgi:DNA-binding NarL/FixJ family response regulator